MRGVIGQRALLERLGARASRGDIAHAYGLFGPRSIGKRTVAIRLAQTLNCLDPGRPSGGCGTCRSCVKIERGLHPDVLVMSRDPALKDISIDQVRAMQQDLALRPLEGRMRVVLIDDAAELNEFGQDALLKTLEEPPKHAVLLMITPARSILHETIQSRLQTLIFRSVATGEIAAALRERGIKDADAIAAAAAGHPGMAIRLASDEGGERTARRALEKEFFALVGSRLTERFAWAASLADESDTRKRSAAIESRFDQWAELLRDAAVTARGLGGIPLRPDRSTETTRIAAKTGARELVDAVLLVQRLRRDLAWNANPRAMLEILALRLPYVEAVAG
ncbi:MAG: DNA polymerase III subunit [Candidatus Limnocylindria bacterium]